MPITKGSEPGRVILTAPSTWSGSGVTSAIAPPSRSKWTAGWTRVPGARPPRPRLSSTSSVREGQVVIYHAWENFQFKDGKGFQNLIATPLNPVELAGGQFHMRPMILAMQPGHTDRDTRVEVQPL